MLELKTIDGSYITSRLHNYNKWLCEQLQSVGELRGTLLDFGAGCGGLTEIIAEQKKVDFVYAHDNNINTYFKLSV